MLHPALLNEFLDRSRNLFNWHVRVKAMVVEEVNAFGFQPFKRVSNISFREVREETVAKYPGLNFKERFIQAYFAGFARKPATTYGTVNAAICERFLGFKSPNACDLIAASSFPDSSSQSSTPYR